MIFTLSEEIAIAALLISLATFIFNYINKVQTTGEAINHEIINLPPYKKGEVSIIKIKNDGNKRAIIDRSYLTFSWDKDLIVELDFETEEDETFELAPHECQVFQKKLPLPPDSGNYTIIINTEYGKFLKTDSFPFYLP